jgi:hypothetical protein
VISILGDLKPPSLLDLELSDELRRYAEVRPEHGQPVCYIGLLEGLKPVMDDWVQVSQFDRYVAVCERAGLYVSANAQFLAMGSDEQTGRVIGARTLTTTRAFAHRVGDDAPDSSVHVFVGADRGAVERTRAAGWYPLVSNGRATSKPWIDHIWFGDGLGYPQCCTEAFARHNNWSVNNMPYQAASRTRQPSTLCNSLMRFSGLGWSAHLPCRYDCDASQEVGAALRAATSRHSSQLADVIDTLLTRPYLICNEWEAFAFDGTVEEPGSIRYRSVTLAPSNRPNLALFEALQGGDRLEIRDNLVVILREDKVVHVDEARTDDFAPRIPFILDFAHRS